MFNLQWKDIKFNKGFIILRNTKSGKNKTIPLNNMIRKILENHPKTDSPYVFPGRGGKKRADITNLANIVKKKAELPIDFRPIHGLRHFYASILANSGELDPYALQYLMTRSSQKVTARYITPKNERLIKVANVMEKEVNKILNRSQNG